MALKILRRNDFIAESGNKEALLLERLQKDSSWECSFLVHLRGKLLFRGHLVLVFECLKQNTRETMQQLGGKIPIESIRRFSYQTLTALSFLHRSGIIHADVKPDNLLINEQLDCVKLGDFGCSVRIAKAQTPSPYLASRYYRAPELILGCDDWTEAVDVWALGCTLFEFYTGSVLFPGNSNEEMVAMFISASGGSLLPRSLLRRSSLSARYSKVQPKSLSPAAEQLFSDKMGSASCKGKDSSALFLNFVHQMLLLNHHKRMSAEKALSHPFLSGVASEVKGTQ